MDRDGRAKRSGSRTANTTIGVRIGVHRWWQRDGPRSQKKAERSEKGRVCALRASTTPLLAGISHSRLPLSLPSRATRRADLLPSPSRALEGAPLSNWARRRSLNKLSKVWGLGVIVKCLVALLLHACSSRNNFCEYSKLGVQVISCQKS
jgi:hypothetical protein